MGQNETLVMDNTLTSREHFSQDGSDSSNKTVPILTISFLLVTLIAIGALRKRRYVSRRPESKMESIPFLPTLPLIGPLHYLLQNRNDIPKLLEKLAIRYGTLAKTYVFGKPVVIIHSPSMLQKLHHSTNPGHLEKPRVIYSKLFIGYSEKGLFLSNVEKWAPHRSILQKAFNYESLKSYVPIININGQKLVADLQEMGSSENMETLNGLLHKCCFEIIGETVLGLSISTTLSQSDRMKTHDSLKRLQEIITYRFYHPWLLPNWIWYFHPKKREQNKCIEQLEQGLRQIMENRKSYIYSQMNCEEFKADNDPKIALDLMLTANWSEEEILSEVSSLLAGGHETISTAMNFLLFILACKPKQQEICRKEVDDLWNCLANSGENISIESISKLKYVERCIKESMRMFPTAPIEWRDLQSPLHLDDDIVLEPGTVVVWNAWGLHRNPKYYENPEEFNPDRFLPENIKNRGQNSYIPFSAGPRNCIGWKMAMIEMTVLTAILLRHFEFSTNDSIENVKINFSVTIFPSKELQINLKARR